MSEVFGQELGGHNQQQDIDDNIITCQCDNACGEGFEGDEVNGHIENCPCRECHHAYGKLN